MSDQILFDKLAYIDKLKSAGISDTEARAHGDALDAALHESEATKTDLRNGILTLDAALHESVATKTDLRNEILTLRNKLTVRMGAVAVALFGALVAIKFFG